MAQEDATMTAFEGSIPIENSQQVAMLASTGVCILLTVVLVALRFVARRSIGRRLDASDFCILAALFFSTALNIDCWIMVLKGGFGFHVAEIAQRFGPESLTLFFQCIMTFALLWCATTLFTKISILFLYTTLFPVRSMAIASRVVGGFIVVWCVASIMAGLLLCQPFAMNWDRTLDGHCGDNALYYTILGVINIICEVVILALPLPIIYSLRMPLLRKFLVAALFSVGLGTCSITIYRQTTLAHLDFADMTHSGLVATLFSALEPSVALMLACVPLLRPLFGGGSKDGEESAPSSSAYASGSSSGGSRIKTGMSRLTGGGIGGGGGSGGGSKNRGGAADTLVTTDDSSDLQLRPMQVSNDVSISAVGDGAGRAKRLSGPQFIKIEKQWEVRG